jgi:DnaJ homolog subfamily C member 17
MPTDDLLDHAKVDIDYYALLGEGVHAGSAEKDISRAYRRTAIKHHPDKNKDDPNAVDRFHRLQIAYEVLSDAAARAIFDAAQTAREAKKQRTAALDGRRRELIDKLEHGERLAFKRKRDPEEEELDREVRRLAEDGQRRRHELQEKMRREYETEVANAATAAEEDAPKPKSQPADKPSSSGPDSRKVVKLRWNAEATDVNKERLEKLFQKFGSIEAVVLKPPKKKKKKTIGSALILFKSLIGAYRAVNGLKDQTGDEWKWFDSIEWVDGKEPDYEPGPKTDE